jgi:hypothetical protein
MLGKCQRLPLFQNFMGKVRIILSVVAFGNQGKQRMNMDDYRLTDREANFIVGDIGHCITGVSWVTSKPLQIDRLRKLWRLSLVE